MKLLAMYLLLKSSEFFCQNAMCMLPATLPDIESEICALLLKKTGVSGSRLLNPQFMFIVSSMP